MTCFRIQLRRRRVDRPKLRGRLIADTDARGYGFGVGWMRAWFEGDAEDARAFLAKRGLMRPAGL